MGHPVYLWNAHNKTLKVNESFFSGDKSWAPHSQCTHTKGLKINRNLQSCEKTESRPPSRAVRSGHPTYILDDVKEIVILVQNLRSCLINHESHKLSQTRGEDESWVKQQQQHKKHTRPHQRQTACEWIHVSEGRFWRMQVLSVSIFNFICTRAAALVDCCHSTID
jgi:hypothetical protein